MYKKLILMITVCVVALQFSGCNKTDNQQSTEPESAVEIPTADSDDSKTAEAVPDITEEDIETDIPVVYEKAEISCTLPKGFKADKNEDGLYVSSNYLKDSATISYIITENNEDNTGLSSDEYKALIEADFLEAYGDEINITINEYKKINVDGRPGLKIKLEYELKGDSYEQLIYDFYNGDESHNLTFTQQKDAGLMEKFEQCGDTIAFVTTE